MRSAIPQRTDRRRAAPPRPTPAAPAPALRARARTIVRVLRRAYPDAACTLDHRGPFELLVATILSAQCTDERVNALTPALFRRYPDAAAFAGADLRALEAAIRPTGFFRTKAKAIKTAARALVDEHGGRVPDDLAALTRLAGVGRKTANVVLATCFGAAAVIVDTHVRRASRRLGLTALDDPEKIERDLMQLLPAADWRFTSQALILHGRRVCHSRRPRCGACQLAPDCPSASPDGR